MPRLSRSKWAEARARWETSPDVTYSDIARELGVSHTTVLQHARREGWVKVASHEARPVGMPAPESVEAYRESATQVTRRHAEWLARAWADLELFRARLMQAIEASDPTEIVRYAAAFGAYMDRLHTQIQREREVWGLTSNTGPEIRIIRRGWVVVNANGTGD
jgi:predicted ArsR family transcriptional regulator